MKNKSLPQLNVRLEKPQGLRFKVPATALARFDRSITMEAAPNEIAILGEIGFPEYGGTDAKAVRTALKTMDGSPVTVLLNSPGGDAFEGIAIHNLLREYEGAVSVQVLGLAASAASIIAMAGDRIEMGDGSMMMIHGSRGIVMGTAEDMQQFATLLDQIDESVAKLYAGRTGQELDDVKSMMSEETWMTAEEAVDMGFADALATDNRYRKKKGAKASASVPHRVVQLAPLSHSPRPAISGQPVLSATQQVPGATGRQSTSINSPTGERNHQMKPIAEQIASFEAKRAASVARLNEIMSKASDAGRSLEESESQEYDGLKLEIKTVDEHLVRMREHEQIQLAAAVPAPASPASPSDDPSAAAARARASEIIVVGPKVDKGIAFTRYVKALAIAKGSLTGALAIAQGNRGWKEQTPVVERVLMAAVQGGDTTSAGWASELVYNQNLVDEFIELLRPQTILGKLPALTKVPFNVRMSGQDSGSSAYWVGQGKPVPVSKLHTLEVTLGIAKAAGLVVLTEELVRSSSPSAELLVRNDLMKAIATFLDVQFVDPNVAAVANVSPASITNGVTAVVPTGTAASNLRADVQTLFKAWINDNLDPTDAAWIMDPVMAMAISLMQNALGQPEFPGMTMTGGTFFGLPVVVSNSANIPGSPDSGHMIILAKQSDILLADDGGLTVDASREAAIQMLDNPTNDAAAGTATTMVSMFQTNSVAIKAVRFMNWKKRRSTAVQYIKEAAYVA